MKTFIKLIICVSLWHSFFVNINNAKAQEALIKEVLTIGTGSKKALAYPTIEGVCKIFNKYSTNYACKPIETRGSEDNLKGITSGKFHMGVLKADMQYNSYNGMGFAQKNPNRSLRSLFGLHMEHLNIIVHKNSNIKDLNNLRGKNIYIGNKGSGSRIFVDRLLQNIGYNYEDFNKVYQGPTKTLEKLLCKQDLDIVLYLIGHPNKTIGNLLNSCDLKMISLPRRDLEKYIGSFLHISIDKIPKGAYRQVSKDLETISSQLVLTTSSNIDEEAINDFVQIIFENYQEIQETVPALKDTRIFDSLLRAGNIPFHPGAKKFYVKVSPFFGQPLFN